MGLVMLTCNYINISWDVGGGCIIFRAFIGCFFKRLIWFEIFVSGLFILEINIFVYYIRELLLLVKWFVVEYVFYCLWFEDIL